MQKHIVWSNMNLNLKDWEDFFNEEYSDADENERYELMIETNGEYLDDERLNLCKIQFNEPIIIIGSLGLWDGRRMGYKEVPSGRISDCLETDNDYVEWYVDGHKNFRATSCHHDGTNYYLYRVWKDGISDEQKDNFRDKLYYGKATPNDISRYTRRVGDYISKVYGW